jgi:thermitase
MFKKISSRLSSRPLSLTKLIAVFCLMALVAQTSLASADDGKFTERTIAERGVPKRSKPVPSATSDLKTVVLADGREALADQIIVSYKKGVSDAEKEAVHGKAAGNGRLNGKAKVKNKLGNDAEVVDIAGVADVEAAVASYAKEDVVEAAEPDYIARTMLTPNDPSFGQQYGMTRIQAPSAWNVTTGSSSVKVAVLDCGIYESGSSQQNGYPGHPDINGKVVNRRDFTGSSTGSDDFCDHGTHVAGIAAAKTNNSVGVAGVGFNVSLMNGKVLNDSGSGATSWITNGIYWATDNGAKVINMSLGGPGSCTSAYQNAINYAYQRNVVVVVAAGNAGTTALQSPASCSNVIAVASTTSTDAKSSFSTYGTWVEVAAPGSNILSTDYNGRYVQKNGTSMAAPHVAGLAGLVWSTGRFSTAQQVINQIQSTSDRISGTGSFWIHGRVNAFRAVS